MSGNCSFTVVIPTFNGGARLVELVSFLLNGLDVGLVLIDSSSTDGSIYEIRNQDYKFGGNLSIVEISQAEFNHGGTRQSSIELVKASDVVVFLTQDARPCAIEDVYRLVLPFDDPLVGSVCGRQLPHEEANCLAIHARKFNYPSHSQKKHLLSGHGMKTVFISNSFAAYRISALKDAGGFPENVILAEDMFLTAKMVLRNWKNVYSAEALCFHSHNYSPWEEFKRYFDIGVFHSRESWIQNSFGGPGREGMKYATSELKFASKYGIGWVVRSMLTTLMKYVGYRFGKLERLLPVIVKRKLSMHKGFWKGL